MSTPGWGPPPAQAPTVCFRHPDRPSGVRCARCGRPACPECLQEAPVGFHCVSCVAEARGTVRTARTVAGAELPTGRARPVVTWSLVGVNVAVFLLTVAVAGSLTNNAASALFDQLALLPGAYGSAGPVGVADGQWWRLLASGFLHYGPMHLALNMYALWILGRDLETVLGRPRFAVLYAVSLLGGSTSVLLFADPNSFTAGASGAVFGLMGGLAVVLLKLRRSPGPVLTIIALNVAISFLVPGISLWGHLGGLTAGAVTTAVLVHAPQARRTQVQAVGVAAVVLVLLVAIAVRVTTLRAGLGL